MRLTLANALQSRDGTLAKDSKLKNCYIDAEENTPNVIKRAGLNLIQTTGDGSPPDDIFVLDGTAYVWRESEPPGSPSLTAIGVDNLFKDFHADYEVFTTTGATAGVFEIDFFTTTYVGFTLRSVGSSAPSCNITQYENDDLISLVDGPEGSGYIGLGQHSVALKLESGFYNLYIDGEIILTAEAMVTIIANPALEVANNNPSVAAFSNPEFLE